MGPRAKVSVESAVNALKKHIKYFIPPEKPKWSSKIWGIISDELGNQWNENAVRTNVNQNRRNILSIALQECGYFSNEINTKSTNYDDVKDENVDSSSSDEGDDNNDPDYCDQAAYFNNIEDIEEFDVELSRELWNSVVKPSSGNSQPKLNKGAWTSIIAYNFWEQYRLKCCFIFDKGYVNVNGNYYLSVKAHCKSKKCGNRLFGFIENVPDDEGPIYIKIKCCDTRLIEKHEDFQRPLRGETRKAVSQQVKNLGVHAYNRRAATRLLRSGDTACPFLYKPNVLHQAKKQFLDNERGITPIDRKDIFPAIDRINENPLYRNSILLVGKPFFVFYATQSQMHCYKEYRRLNKKSSVCIDATGGLVRKIVSEGKKSSYIFLYQIVINFNKTSQCVYQMLTEMQDTHTITLWLNKWVSAVKLLPHEAVSDGSRAQLNAMSRAFNDMSLKQYIKICFESLKNSQKLTDIKTYIRLDVAHFVHTITGWSCFKSAVHPSVKKFYVYCICLLIDCEFLKFERILMLILIISNTAHEESIVDVNDEKFTPFIARTELENLIMCRKVEKFFLNVSEQIEKMEVDPEKNKFRDTELENSEKDSISISSWIKNLLKVSKNVTYHGNKLQSFFLPALENPLVEAVVEFPLWTNICIPHSDARATSSYVEEDFKDLKMALKRQVSLPTDIYTFLKLHLDYLIGGVSLLRMKITKFIDENINNTEKSIPDLLNCNLSEINVENDDSFKNSMKEEKKTNNTSDSEPTDITNTSNQFDQGVSITSDIDTQINLDVNTDNSVNINYNLSDIIEKKNKNDPFENWRGKGINNKLNPFDWMASGKSANGYETKPEIRTNFKPKDVGKFSNITHVNDDSNLNNTNSKIKLANNYPKDHGSNIKTYQVDDDSGSITKIKALQDHDYGFTTSTPLENKKPKKTLAAAIDKVARQNINSGKYFNDCPEIKLQNKFVKAGKKSVTSEEKSSKKKIYLLHNGNYCNAIPFKGCQWLLFNTCPFDTIIHLLFEGALQDFNFSEFCENSENSVFQFLINFKKQGSTADTYERRLQILYSIYKDTEIKQQKIGKENHIAVPISRTIICQDNVSSLWTRLFTNEPSIIEKNSCPTPNCKGNNIINITNFPINYTIVIKHGFSSLQKAIEFDNVIYNMPCKYCHGKKRTRQQNPNAYIYIELDVRTPEETMGRKCKLRELQTYLTLPVIDEDDNVQNFRYRLSGVAGYTNNHYIAYCRRLSGAWISYDDTTKKPNSETSSCEVLPHGVLYIRSLQ